MEIITFFFSSWLLVSLLCLFLYTLRLMNRSWSVTTGHKLPPNPPKIPIFGNLHQLLGKPRHQALWQLSKEYGPIMLLHIGSKPYIVVSSPAMAKQVLKTKDHIFCSRTMSRATKRFSYNNVDIAFSPHNDHWREMRKLLVSEFLGPKRARSFNHVLVSEIESMICSLSLHASANTAVNLSDLILATVKGVVCKAAFGKNYPEQPLNGPSWEVMLEETMEILNGSLGDFFPWLGRFIDQFSGWNGKLEKCFSNLDAYIETIVDEHHNHTFAAISDEDKDFVHTLVELSLNENAYGYRLTRDDVKALVMDVLTGGIDTTVVTVVWAMSEIVRSSRVMQKLQCEILNCTGKQKVNELDIAKLTYLKMVVKETLRLHTPAPLLVPHESLSHCQIGGYDVFPRTTVLINGWGMGRDPSIWGENAADFYPERFENIAVDFGGGNFEMVPFGGGRRSCPAMNNALATVEFMIANLLYWFDWEVPNGMKNEDLNMHEMGSLIVRKKLPLYLVPTIKHNQ